MTYDYSPQSNSNDPEVIDVLDKNKRVEKRSDLAGQRYPLATKNRLAAFIAKYKYQDYNEVPGGVAYTATMLTRNVNIEIRMPPDVKLKEIFSTAQDGLFLLEKVNSKWTVSRQANCQLQSDNRIFCENIWLKPNERLLYCFSLINWRKENETLTPDREECESYCQQAATMVHKK